ncbi:hypothetical protein ACOME3_007255 [Neoechinorhynchus agilis]
MAEVNAVRPISLDWYLSNSGETLFEVTKTFDMLKSRYSDEWISTGLWALNGVEVRISLETISSDDWRIQIGCHTDDLHQKTPFKRWPVMTKRWSLEQGDYSIYSPFGGLLYIIAGKPGSYLENISVSGACRAPFYNNMSIHKNVTENNNNAPWAEFAGRNIIFTLPSSMREVCYLFGQNLKAVQESVNQWDSIIDLHHKLRGSVPQIPERVIADIQHRGGHLHNGYPIMGLLDLANPESDIFPFTPNKMLTHHRLIHELGHNMQRQCWTFNGCHDVSVNWFVMHALYHLRSEETKQHLWNEFVDEHMKQVHTILKSTTTSFDWSPPNIGLVFFALLFKEFGFTGLQAVLSSYENEPRSSWPKNDEQRIYTFLERYGNSIQRNIVPYCRSWKVKTDLNKLEEVMGQYPSFNSFKHID